MPTIRDKKETAKTSPDTAVKDQTILPGMKQHSKAYQVFRSTVIVLLSAFFGSSVQIFVMIPCGMTSGGMPGIVRLITHFFPQISYSVVYYTLSMMILILVFFTMGKAEVGRIIALAF